MNEPTIGSREVQLHRLLLARDRATMRVAFGTTGEMLAPLGLEDAVLRAFARGAERATANDPPGAAAAICCGFFLALELIADT